MKSILFLINKNKNIYTELIISKNIKFGKL